MAALTENKAAWVLRTFSYTYLSDMLYDMFFFKFHHKKGCNNITNQVSVKEYR